MPTDIERDFQQLRHYFRSLSSVGEAFAASAVPAGENVVEHSLVEIVPWVWLPDFSRLESIPLVVFSQELVALAEVWIHSPEGESLPVELVQAKTDFPASGASRIVQAIISWVEASLSPPAFRVTTVLQEVESVELQEFVERAVVTVRPLLVEKAGPDRWKVEFEFLRSDLPDDGAEVLTAGPSIGPLEIGFVHKATRSGWNAQHSNFLAAFEHEVAETVGAKYAIATSSCTGALHLSLAAAGVGPGDEVIVPDITWVATGSVVKYLGAYPVFADVCEESWTIDDQALEPLFSARTKAIIPVHLYGMPANMARIRALAEAHNIAVVEDAAPALGASWLRQPVGAIGDAGCFSFQGAKMLVTGEGGMLVTNSEDIYQKAKKLQEHGRRPGTFWIDELGYKYKMSNIQAALGLAQVKRLSNQIERKTEINEHYRSFLAGDTRVAFQTGLKEALPTNWMSSISLVGGFGHLRDPLISFLSSRGIDSRPVFPRMAEFPIWGGQARPVNEKALAIANSGINLPSGVNLRKETIRRVCHNILEFLDIHAR